MRHNEMASRNRAAWNAASYEAWTERYGPPSTAASRIMADPLHTARRIVPYIGDTRGLRLANPLGSHGSVAVALSLLGAEAAVFDISASNARYARELATAAGVAIDYVEGDFLRTARAFKSRFDGACMELGVTHYFGSLDGFVEALRLIVVPGGTVVLGEFHPLAKKALAVEKGNVRLVGDYFANALEAAATPYEVFVSDEVPECVLRRWTLGQTVTAFAQGGFRIETLVEHPHASCAAVPGEFTLVAMRM